MVGGGAGGVCGEVMKRYLTIGKADKQGDLGLFGEVLPYFRQDFFCECRTSVRDALHRSRRWLLSWSQMASEQVRDVF